MRFMEKPDAGGCAFYPARGHPHSPCFAQRGGLAAVPRGKCGRRHGASFDLQCAHQKRAAAAAVRDQRIGGERERRQRRRSCRVEHARAQDTRRQSADRRRRAGIGGATARTRLWIRVASCDQSMRPSSGLRPPKYDPAREIQRDARRRAGEKRGQDAIERDFGGDGHLVEDVRAPCRRAGSAPPSARRCRRRRASPPCSGASRPSRVRRAAPPSSPARGRGTWAAASRAC